MCVCVCRSQWWRDKRYGMLLFFLVLLESKPTNSRSRCIFQLIFFSFALLRVYMQTKLPAFARTSRVKKRHSWITRLNKLVYKYTMDIRVTVYDNYRMWFNIIRIRYLWLLAKETVGFNFPFRYLRVRIRNGLFRWSKITTNREREGAEERAIVCVFVRDADGVKDIGSTC